MTELIITGRDGGKTRRCIELAVKNNAYIVCPSHRHALHIVKVAEEMGYDILFPITWSEFATGAFGHLIRAFVIDDVDQILVQMAKGIPILGMSMNEAPEIPVRSRPIIQDDKHVGYELVTPLPPISPKKDE